VKENKEPADGLHEIPASCPVTGGPLIATELSSLDGSIKLRGRFRLPPAALLDPDNHRILEVFLRSRGVITTMEKELGLSYPTVRARIDNLLLELGLRPYRTSQPSRREAAAKRGVLEQLERGEITAEQAKSKLKLRNGEKD